MKIIKYNKINTQLNICALVPAPLRHLHYTNFLQWCYLGQICNKFGANLASQFKRCMLEGHLLEVLSRTNLVSDISTKE